MVSLALALFAASCGSALSSMTAERASWSYVAEAWGGLRVGSPIAEGRTVALPIMLALQETRRMESGTCVVEVLARVERQRIILSLQKGFCSGATLAQPVARFQRPAPGDYVVVYDDQGASWPVVGRVKL